MNEYNFAESLVLGGKTMLIGMIVVFVGLAILIGCITLMGKLIHGSGKKKTAAPAVPAASDKEPVPAPVPEETEDAEENGDDALIAVITAAVVAVWDRKDTGFTVRRVRRCRS